jgi:hypothetical protein
METEKSSEAQTSARVETSKISSLDAVAIRDF